MKNESVEFLEIMCHLHLGESMYHSHYDDIFQQVENDRAFFYPL